jgi:hypothetical protein
MTGRLIGDVPDWFREQNQYVPRPELENEVSDLFARQTRSHNPYRLVTLHGMGGIGKTRLGMQCCLNAAGMFEGRLFLAHLDGISDEALVADETRRDYLVGEIAKAFNLSDPPVTAQNLPEHLPNDGPMLLLLDNYETVKGAASARLLVRLLDARPTLRLLVTSRVKVGLIGLEIAQNVEGLQPREARELLLTRVCERRGDFEWTPSAAEETAISHILVETARIPLALELVAAHVGELSLIEIAMDLAKEPLGEMVQMPEGSYPSDPSGRHETLEKCYNWSWRLLGAEAQKALVCLSMFADRCSFEEIACCFPEIKQTWVTRLLAKLTFRTGLSARFPNIKRASLVQLHQASLANREEVAGSSLYTLLRPTRLYARKRLRELDANQKWQDHFVAYYVQFVKEYGGADNREDGDKQARIEASWRHAISAAEIAALLKDAVSCENIANGLFSFVDRHVLWTDALPLYVQSVDIAMIVLGTEHPATGSSLNNLAILYDRNGDYAAAEPLLQSARAISERVWGVEHPTTATVLINLANLYNRKGNYAASEPLCH